MHLLFGGVRGGHPFKHFRYGILALGALTKHVFRAHGCLHVDAGHAGTLLPAVVLFLHQQVEFLPGIAARAVFLFVIVEWLQQANHCHATFML